MTHATERRTSPRYVNPSTLAKPSGYSNGVAYGGGGGAVFLAGQIGWDAEGRMVSGRFADQFDQALANLLAVVADAGGSPESVGKLTIYVLDCDEYRAARAEIGERYRRRMGRHYPAMTLVEVRALVEPDARVEIEGIAWL
ncbi:MAG TPA: RidA family protein [Vicinamibacterales bacterium]|jgi:enamine deaminase RidA (YjgF/YER057c/UK114 family)|nr:RidA family protein [Vicinamibacterales bacterium]